MRVPDSWVTATVSRRKEQKAIGGRAGRRRRRQRTCDEKTIDSKVKYLKDAAPEELPSAPAPKLVVPEAMVPSSSDDDLEVYTHVQGPESDCLFLLTIFNKTSMMTMIYAHIAADRRPD